MGSKIRTSVHGRLLGINHNDETQSKGFVSGDEGNQIAHPSPSKVVLFDDFTGDIIADQYSLLEGTDNVTTDAAILAGGIGGVLRITSGDAGTGLAADLAEVVQALQWQASNGGLSIQVRAKLSAIMTAYAFIGFTDLAATLEAPVISAGAANTLTTNATDAVGFMFDTNMSTDNWWAVGVAADVDATAINVGHAPVADTYAVFRIDVDAAGKATFYYNGAQVGTMAGALTAATDLTPVLAVGSFAAATRLLDVDYLHVAMNR